MSTQTRKRALSVERGEAGERAQGSSNLLGPVPRLAPPRQRTTTAGSWAALEALHRLPSDLDLAELLAYPHTVQVDAGPAALPRPGAAPAQLNGGGGPPTGAWACGASTDETESMGSAARPHGGGGPDGPALADDLTLSGPDFDELSDDLLVQPDDLDEFEDDLDEDAMFSPDSFLAVMGGVGGAGADDGLGWPAFGADGFSAAGLLTAGSAALSLGSLADLGVVGPAGGETEPAGGGGLHHRGGWGMGTVADTWGMPSVPPGGGSRFMATPSTSAFAAMAGVPPPDEARFGGLGDPPSAAASLGLPGLSLTLTPSMMLGPQGFPFDLALAGSAVPQSATTSAASARQPGGPFSGQASGVAGPAGYASTGRATPGSAGRGGGGGSKGGKGGSGRNTPAPLPGGGHHAVASGAVAAPANSTVQCVAPGCIRRRQLAADGSFLYCRHHMLAAGGTPARPMCEVHGCERYARLSSEPGAPRRFCVKHMMAAGLTPLSSGPQCCHPGCTKLAQQSTDGQKLYCPIHMTQHGLQVDGVVCAHAGCCRPATFSLSGECTYCVWHMREHGLQPMARFVACEEPGCRRQSTLSSSGVRRYCRAHMGAHGLQPMVNTPCKVDGCTRQAMRGADAAGAAAGLCRLHARATGVPLSGLTTCAHAGCDKVAQYSLCGVRLYCDAHMRAHNLQPRPTRVCSHPGCTASARLAADGAGAYCKTHMAEAGLTAAPAAKKMCSHPTCTRCAKKGDDGQWLYCKAHTPGPDGGGLGAFPAATPTTQADQPAAAMAAAATAAAAQPAALPLAVVPPERKPVFAVPPLVGNSGPSGSGGTAPYAPLPLSAAGGADVRLDGYIPPPPAAPAAGPPQPAGPAGGRTQRAAADPATPCQHEACTLPGMRATDGVSFFCKEHMAAHSLRAAPSAQRRCHKDGCTKWAKRSTTGVSLYCKAHMKEEGLQPTSSIKRCAHPGCTHAAKPDTNGKWLYCKGHMQQYGMWPRDYKSQPGQPARRGGGGGGAGAGGAAAAAASKAATAALMAGGTASPSPAASPVPGAGDGGGGSGGGMGMPLGDDTQWFLASAAQNGGPPRAHMTGLPPMGSQPLAPHGAVMVGGIGSAFALGGPRSGANSPARPGTPGGHGGGAAGSFGAVVGTGAGGGRSSMPPAHRMMHGPARMPITTPPMWVDGGVVAPPPPPLRGQQAQGQQGLPHDHGVHSYMYPAGGGTLGAPTRVPSPHLSQQATLGMGWTPAGGGAGPSRLGAASPAPGGVAGARMMAGLPPLMHVPAMGLVTSAVHGGDA